MQAQLEERASYDCKQVISMVGYRPPLDSRWSEARAALLAAVSDDQRQVVADLLRHPHHGGVGLRMLLRALATDDRPMPQDLPQELVQIYLDDPEAVPLHDCAVCGIPIPVHADRSDPEGPSQRIYFASCPRCGGQTGLYAYWSNTDKR